MVRSKEAIDRARRNQDEAREKTPTKVRLVQERIEQIDRIAKRMKIEARAQVVYEALDALEEKLKRKR